MATFGKSVQKKKTGKASTLRKLPISVTSTSLPEELCFVFSKDLPLSNSNVIPRSAAGGASAAQPTPCSSSTLSKCQRWAQFTQQPPSQPHTKRGPLGHDRARSQGYPTESAGGSRPGQLSRLRTFASRSAGGKPGRQEGSHCRGERRPHLDPDLIGGEAAPADPHRLRVAHIDLEEVAGRPVGVIQILRLGDQPPGVRHRLRHFAVAAAAAGSLRPLRVPPTPPRGHRVRAQRSRGERARKASVHPAREAPPRAPPRLPPLVPRKDTADSPDQRAPGGRSPDEAADGDCALGGIEGRSHEPCSHKQVSARLQCPQCTGRARRRWKAA